MPAKVTRQLWLTNNRPGEIVESEVIETISTKTYFYLSVFFVFFFCKFVQFKKCSYRYRTSLTCFEVHKILKISFLAVQVFCFFLSHCMSNCPCQKDFPIRIYAGGTIPVFHLFQKKSEQGHFPFSVFLYIFIENMLSVPGLSIRAQIQIQYT